MIWSMRTTCVFFRDTEQKQAHNVRLFLFWCVMKEVDMALFTVMLWGFGIEIVGGVVGVLAALGAVRLLERTGGKAR